MAVPGDATIASRELPLVCAGESDQLRQGAEGNAARVHQEDAVDLHHQGQKAEGGARIEIRVRIEMRVGGDVLCQRRQRVAIGCGAGAGLEADDAAGAGAVIDDDGLAQPLR
jgi:hypothetical protein